MHSPNDNFIRQIIFKFVNSKSLGTLRLQLRDHKCNPQINYLSSGQKKQIVELKMPSSVWSQFPPPCISLHVALIRYMSTYPVEWGWWGHHIKLSQDIWNRLPWGKLCWKIIQELFQDWDGQTGFIFHWLYNVHESSAWSFPFHLIPPPPTTGISSFFSWVLFVPKAFASIQMRWWLEQMWRGL